MRTGERVQSGARTALWLLLGINLFNYIDRYVLAAVEPEIEAHFFAPGDPNAHALTGLLGTAFLVSYMISAPIFGWLADRTSRWLIIGAGVILWPAEALPISQRRKLQRSLQCRAKKPQHHVHINRCHDPVVAPSCPWLEGIRFERSRPGCGHLSR